MKNNKGFTLIEIISVIVLLGLIIGIAVPSILTVNTNIKKKTLQTKVDNIEQAAVLFGQKHRENFTETCNEEGAPCYGITEGECKCYGSTFKDSSGTEKIITTITVSKIINPSQAITEGDYTEQNVDGEENGYIKPDDESDKIYNSLDESKELNDCKIQIYKKYGKIYAIYLARDTEDETCWYK